MISLPAESRWIVIGDPFYDPIKQQSRVLCRCACGTEKIVLLGNLTRGKTISCGCVRNRLAGDRARTHGLSKTSEYNIWKGIKDRCFNTENDAYDRYGGRGITICERWLKFEDFLTDVGPRPSPKHTIDRYPDKNGNYEPGNVRWADAKEQANNTRRNRLLTFNGRTLTIAGWTAALGFQKTTISQRIKLGWSVERMLTEPERKVRHRGEIK